MAVSGYRQGKWTPKKVSKDFNESESYKVEIVRQHYRFFFVDHSNVDGRFGLQYEGYSVGSAAAAAKTKNDLAQTASDTAGDEITANTVNGDAKTVLNDAKTAVAAIKITVDHAKRLLAIANDLVATSEDWFKTGGSVYNLIVVSKGGYPFIAHLAYISAGVAKAAVEKAVKKAGGPDADAFLDAETLMVALGKLDQTFRSVEKAFLDQNNKLINPGKDVVTPLTKAAQKDANTAVDAGVEALRTATSFKDTAADAFKSATKELNKAIADAKSAKDASDAFKPDYTKQASLGGVFEISGCTGVPEKARFLRRLPASIRPERASVGDDAAFLKWVELPSEADFTLVKYLPPIALDPSPNRTLPTPVLEQTPGLFKISPSWHLSYFDKLWFDGKVGGLLPFFYNDKQRTFFVPSSIWSNNVYELSSVFGNVICNYPDIKKAVRRLGLSLLQSDSDKRNFVE